MTVSGMKRRDELKSELEIDPDDLDRCLIEHSNLLFQAEDAFVEAVAQYDAIALEIEEFAAEQDEKLRRKAAEDEGKRVTEDAIKQAIKRIPKMHELQRDLLAAKLEMGKCKALREGYHKRSSMLEKISDRELAFMRSLSLERGVSSARSSLTAAQADANKSEISKVRRVRS